MSDKRNIYFTSDWHIGSESVIKYSNRPFVNSEEMHKSLIRRYNSIVGNTDICYFLGDMAFCGTEETKEVMDQLNGTKILILGNHDRKMYSMANSGFDVVMNSGSLYVTGELVTFTHCPLRGVFREDTTGMNGAMAGENWHKEKKHTQFSIENQGQFHLHGHLHAPNNGKSEVKVGRQWDIGVDGNNYTPVSMSQIESWIFLTKRNEKILDGNSYRFNQKGQNE